MFKRCSQFLKHLKTSSKPRYRKSRRHSITEKNLSPNALKVLSRLQKAGYQAYLVGGGVRDMLLHLRPTDFDAATNAKPEEIRRLFRNSRLIGRRFRLVHVYFSGEIIEVSTFRANVEDNARVVFPENEKKVTTILSEDNTYGTIEEDAWRRDFTINALYYNIADRSVVDFTGGMKDLKHRWVRMIGDPVQRYHEDPLRLLRAVRLSAKLDFNIEHNTKKPLYELQHLLKHLPSARLFEEIIKLFFKGHAHASYEILKEMGYMQALFPDLMQVLDKKKKNHYSQLIENALKATDQRYAEELSLNPGFLFSVFLWPIVQALLDEQIAQKKKWFPALYYSVHTAISRQKQTLAISQRLSVMMRSVWMLQYQLERRRPSRIYRVSYQRYFRAAVDFLELRAKSGESVSDLANWWKLYRDAKPRQRERMLADLMEK